MAKDPGNLVELVLKENGELYYLHVSREDCLRAAEGKLLCHHVFLNFYNINNAKTWCCFLCIDEAFAHELLDQYKATIDQQAL